MQCLSINTDVEVVKTKPTQYCKVKIKNKTLVQIKNKNIQ